MNKQDWKEYIDFLRQEIKIEGNKKDTNSREGIIKSYNLGNLYNDLNDSKRQSLLI